MSVLREAFIDELKDLLDAERQLLKRCRRRKKPLKMISCGRRSNNMNRKRDFGVCHQNW